MTASRGKSTQTDRWMKRTETISRVFPFAFTTTPVIPLNGPSVMRTGSPAFTSGTAINGRPASWSWRTWSRSAFREAWSVTSRIRTQRCVFSISNRAS